jgi:hypothetical protein
MRNGVTSSDTCCLQFARTGFATATLLFSLLVPWPCGPRASVSHHGKQQSRARHRGNRRGVARLARASHTVWCWRETVVTRGLVRAALRVGAVRRSVGARCRVRRRARGRTRRRRLIGNRFLALRGVGPESEAECVRFHGRRVTKVGPEVKHGQLLRRSPLRSGSNPRGSNSNGLALARLARR